MFSPVYSLQDNFLYKFIYLLLFFRIYFIDLFFWLFWVFVPARGLSLVAVRGGYPSLLVWASHCGGFSCCRVQALGAQDSVVAAHRLSSCGSRALEHRLSSCGARA